MRKKAFTRFVLFIVLAISGCHTSRRTAPSPISSPVVTPQVMSTQVNNTPSLLTTKGLPPTPIITSTIPVKKASATSTIPAPPLPTLSPEEARLLMLTWLREPTDCDAPCFWGITPGKTTQYEVEQKFRCLGVKIFGPVILDGNEYLSGSYMFRENLEIGITLRLIDDIVQSMKVGLSVRGGPGPAPREDWKMFSPDRLILKYGSPSSVTMNVDMGPTPSFQMALYFTSNKIIIAYEGTFNKNVTFPSPCPITDGFEYIQLWLGEKPENTPPAVFSLEKATSLTFDEFIALMTGDPDKACINLNWEIIN